MTDRVETMQRTYCRCDYLEQENAALKAERETWRMYQVEAEKDAAALRKELAEAKAEEKLLRHALGSRWETLEEYRRVVVPQYDAGITALRKELAEANTLKERFKKRMFDEEENNLQTCQELDEVSVKNAALRKRVSGLEEDKVILNRIIDGNQQCNRKQAEQIAALKQERDGITRHATKRIEELSRLSEEQDIYKAKATDWCDEAKHFEDSCRELEDEVDELKKKSERRWERYKKVVQRWRGVAEDLAFADCIVCKMNEVIEERAEQIAALREEAALHATTEAAHIAEQERLRKRIEKLEGRPTFSTNHSHHDYMAVVQENMALKGRIEDLEEDRKRIVTDGGGYRAKAYQQDERITALKEAGDAMWDALSLGPDGTDSVRRQKRRVRLEWKRTLRKAVGEETK